jgi:hypothetical protein
MVLEAGEENKGLTVCRNAKSGVRDGVSEVPAPNTCLRNEKCSIPLCPRRSFQVENEKSVVMVSFRRSGLSMSSLQQAYSEALERCKLARDGSPPKAEHIQVLLQAWRQLRRVG